MPTQVFFETLINEWNQIKVESENEEVAYNILFFCFKNAILELKIIYQKSKVKSFKYLGRKRCEEN